MMTETITRPGAGERIRNGVPIPDTNGEPIHAHGGWILPHGGWYYWYGEDRRGDGYVACYRSRDLHAWEPRGLVLHAGSPTAPMRIHSDLTLRRADGGKVNIERPKVLRAPDGRFVLWAHYENGADYGAAAACVATADAPDGPFTYRGSFRPLGEMSRDCTLFLDDDGTAYFLSASRDNADLHLYRLTEDLLGVDCLLRTLHAGEFREAPALFKRDGKYILITSHCTGWAPNQGTWVSADSLSGRFSPPRPFGDATTYRSQPAFVLPTPDGRYLYFGDRWGGGGEAYFTSTYVILPIDFDGAGAPSISWDDSAPI